MKRTARKNRYVQAALAGILTAGIIGTSSAQLVFPPDHLHRSARFVAHITSPETLRIPWYHTNNAEAREHLIAEETKRQAPHLRRYYFLNMRSFGNPSSQRLDGLQSSDTATEVKIVDDSAVNGDES